MADNITLDAMSGGSNVAADDISGAKFQRIKLIHGTESVNDGDVSSANPLPVDTQSSTGVQRLPLFRYLDTNGDGTGTKNAVGDYSTPDIFYIQPAAGTIYRINRLIVLIEDGNNTMTATKYGGISALSTGIQLRVQDDSGTVIDITNGITVKGNAQWAALCYDVQQFAWGGGNDLLGVRFTLGKSGQMLRLDGDANERFEVVLNDNMAGLVSHYFMVQGYDEGTPT